jgi:hypothetical protein
MTNKTDLIIILAVLGLAVFILAKLGIFKLTNTASDLANTAVEGVNKIADDIVNLPENLGYITNPQTWEDVLKSATTQVENSTGWDLPFPSFNDEVARPTVRASNIVNNLKYLYPNIDPLVSSRMAVEAGITWDSNGNPVYH